MFLYQIFSTCGIFLVFKEDYSTIYKSKLMETNVDKCQVVVITKLFPAPLITSQYKRPYQKGRQVMDSNMETGLKFVKCNFEQCTNLFSIITFPLQCIKQNKASSSFLTMEISYCSLVTDHFPSFLSSSYLPSTPHSQNVVCLFSSTDVV